MGATPLHEQPSRYVRTAWAGKPLGAVRLLKVQAAHNSQDLIFRLEWADESKNLDYADGSVFPDGAGILFPMNGDAPLLSMGSEKKPVNAWFWRANFAEGEAQNLVAKGLGTVSKSQKSKVHAQARHQDGRWQVVFARELGSGGAEGASLNAEKKTRVAFAVWEGASQERGGLKSFSKEWADLAIE